MPQEDAKLSSAENDVRLECQVARPMLALNAEWCLHLYGLLTKQTAEAVETG